jgi:hypothetical protein
MSNFVNWIGAAGDGELAEGVAPLLVQPKSVTATKIWPKPGAHNFPAEPSDEAKTQIAAERDWQGDPDLWLYRKKTIALLRRYMRWSLEAGRLPSLLGRELFRGKISAFTATTFEARVIFLHDIERCLDRLQDFDRQIIARVVLQEYDHEAAARILQCTRRTLERRLPELIDELSESLLRSDLLERLPETTEETR